MSKTGLPPVFKLIIARILICYNDLVHSISNAIDICNYKPVIANYFRNLCQVRVHAFGFRKRRDIRHVRQIPYRPRSS